MKAKDTGLNWVFLDIWRMSVNTRWFWCGETELESASPICSHPTFHKLFHQTLPLKINCDPLSSSNKKQTNLPMASVFPWLSTPTLTLRPPGIWPSLRSSTLGEAVQNQSHMMQVSSTWCCFSRNFWQVGNCLFFVWPFSSFKTRSLSGYHMIFKLFKVPMVMSWNPPQPSSSAPSSWGGR